MSEVLSDGTLAIVAGSDTTSTMMSNLFWLLLCNPHTYSLLQQEVDKNFRNEEHALDTVKHANMPYLNAAM
jgi:cytochrome P450